MSEGNGDLTSHDPISRTSIIYSTVVVVVVALLSVQDRGQVIDSTIILNRTIMRFSVWSTVLG